MWSGILPTEPDPSTPPCVAPAPAPGNQGPFQTLFPLQTALDPSVGTTEAWKLPGGISSTASWFFEVTSLAWGEARGACAQGWEREGGWGTRLFSGSEIRQCQGVGRSLGSGPAPKARGHLAFTYLDTLTWVHTQACCRHVCVCVGTCTDVLKFTFTH